MGLRDTLIVETEAAFTILGLLLVFLPMFLSVLARTEGRRRCVARTSLWSLSPGLCRR